ncbi:hypothetical protein CRE_29189 [Caenorhabditis remanei]|uniref:Uncharacterized protein n=1 Tax=Caenorhabditis remanei TaxID=31234 RepID=E3ND58_CAERE|nr:hypothetical protein CRE_29189 [Caenorhabditis remanei]
MRKTFKQCQFEFNASEMNRFRWIDEYCTWAAFAKIALLIPMVMAVMSDEQVFKLKIRKNLCHEKKENKILDPVYFYSFSVTGCWQFLSGCYMIYIWRSVNRYRGIDDRKINVVLIISVELLSIVTLSVTIYQYFVLPSEKYIKMNSAFFYCIGYGVWSIIATGIYLKFLISYCKQLLNYCEQKNAVMWPDEF